MLKRRFQGLRGSTCSREVEPSQEGRQALVLTCLLLLSLGSPTCMVIELDWPIGSQESPQSPPPPQITQMDRGLQLSPFRRFWTLTATAIMSSRLNPSQVNTEATLWGSF